MCLGLMLQSTPPFQLRLSRFGELLAGPCLFFDKEKVCTRHCRLLLPRLAGSRRGRFHVAQRPENVPASDRGMSRRAISTSALAIGPSSRLTVN